MKKIIYIFTIVFCAQLVQAQQRNVAWVHGLGETESDWQHYEQIFTQERNINSMRRSHITGSGLNVASIDLESKMRTHYGNTEAYNSQNIGIGHSMGGLMIRNTDRRHPAQGDKYFGGYITVSTPNYGAGIANSVLNGNVAAASADACSKLTAGPTASLLGSVISLIANVTNNDVCDLFLNNEITSQLNYYTGTSTQDLKRGSVVIDSINNYTNNLNHNIPRISIWGEENSPVHWRLLTTVGNFDAVQAATTGRNIYQFFHIFNKVRGYACAIGGFWNPGCWVQSAVYFYKASQWKKGRDWFDNSESIWNSLIQTTRLEPHTYWENVWVPCPYPPIAPFNGRNIDPNCGHWEEQMVTRYVAVNYPSDGFIPKYSQIMTNNPTPNNRYRVNKANHIEILDMTHDGNNVDETKETLDDVFDRQVGDFFRLD